MLFKLFAPLAVFVGLGLTSLYSISPTFNPESLDYNFYNDPDLFNKLQHQSFIYKEGIESDEIGARDYFFQNSLGFMWRKPPENGQQNGDIEYGNAFLLNILYPDWMSQDNYERHFYSPKSYRGQDEIVLLLGTSLSFVSKVFDKVTDFSNNVNNETNCKKLENSSSSGKASGNELYLAHPYPIFGGESGYKTSQTTQDYLYRWDEKDDAWDHYDFGLKKAFYTKLNSENVCLAYAAAGLEVNEKLLDLSISKSPNFSKQLQAIHEETNSNYVGEVANLYGKKYKLAADFAVIQIKIGANNLKSQWLRYMEDLYKKLVVLPKVYRGDLQVFGGKTQPLYMAGWERMNERLSDFHTMRNLFVEADVEDRSNTKPSEITSVNSSDANQKKLTIKLFDKFSERESSNPSESKEYEVTDVVFSPNDVDGVLYVNYKIKNKNKGWVLPEPQSLIFSGLQSVESDNSNNLSEYLSSWNSKFKSRNDKLKDFLESKPRVSAAWKEYELDYSYFSYKSLRDVIFERAILPSSQELKDNDMSRSLTTFKLGGNEYVNIGHHLMVPNMHIDSYKGAPVLMQDFSNKYMEGKEKTLIGMYAGTRDWKNPLGKQKSMGEIMMFISPWTYDLFNKSNKLSKPSLADSLDKKNSTFQNYIVQRNRWISGE